MTASLNKPTPNPYSPRENFFRAWDKDDQGRWIYVGLDHDETQELLRLSGSALFGDELVIVTADIDRGSIEDTDRYLALHDRHEIARLQRLGREMAERMTPRPMRN